MGGFKSLIPNPINNHINNVFKNQKQAGAKAPESVEVDKDDMGLITPGYRNISVVHELKYYNYTEISLLNQYPDYRFEKSGIAQDAQD